MKAKTLIGIAVAGAFGLSTAAYAGPGHSKWVAAGEEQYPAMIFGTEMPQALAAIEVIDVTVIEPVGATFSSGDERSVSSDELSSLSMDESLALADEGVYSDFILTSVPVTIESWDLYVLYPDESSADQLAALEEESSSEQVAALDEDSSSDQLAALDDFMISTHDLAALHDSRVASEESLG